MVSTSLDTAADTTSQAPLNEEQESDEGGVLELDQLPEGGVVGWCTVAGAMLVLFCGFGYARSYGVYQDFYALNYLTDRTPSEISWIGSLNTFLGTAIGIVAGALHDRGYFYHLLIGGSLLQSFSLFMLSLSRPGQYYAILLAQGLALGIGQGIVYFPTMAVVSQHFRKRRILAMSLVTCGSALGSIIHPIMLNHLFNGSIGFANGVRISTAMITVMLFVACLLMRTRSGPRKQSPNYSTVARGIARDVPFCIMCFALLCFQTSNLFPVFYIQLYSVGHGNSATFSFYSLALLNGGNLVARLSGSFIEDRVGVINMWIVGSAACGILILSMIGIKGVASVVILLALYGYFSGICVGLLAALMAYLTTDMSEVGVRIGVGMLFVGIGGLISGPISGALLTPQYKWLQTCLFNGILGLLGSVLLVMMKLALARRQKRATETRTVRSSS